MKAFRAFSARAPRNLSGGVAFMRQVGAFNPAHGLAKGDARLYLCGLVRRL
jgi:hypothetical protein